MDLAEKRKQLEAVRAARQAKQQVVEQYMTGRSSNASSSPAMSPAPAAAVPSPRGPAPVTAKPTSTAASGQASPRPDPSTPAAAVGAGGPSRKGSFASAAGTAGGPLAPPSPPAGGGAADDSRRITPRARAATPTAAPPSAAAAAAVKGPSRTASPSSPAKLPASPLHSRAAPGSVTPLIQVLSVNTPPAAATPAAAAAAAAAGGPTSAEGRATTPLAAAPAARGSAGGRNSMSTSGMDGGSGTPKPAAAATPVKRASPMRGSADAKAQSPAKAAHVDVRAEGRGGGWNSLQYCLRSGSSTVGRDLASENPTRPVCVFNPAVMLGDVTGSTDSSRRRVILDATACLVPYEGAAASAASVDGEGASTIWSVCVAATYGAKSSSLLGGAGGGAGAASADFVTSGGSGARRGSMESAAAMSGELLHGGRGGRAAEAALAGVRASMECGYPWGSAAAAAQTAVPGTTMDAALRVARESPGLVLAWCVVPLPPNTVPQKEGTLYADASTSAGEGSFAAGHGAAGAGGTATSADYIVIVVPLVCDSEVTTVLAHPFQPSTLLGGTRCGRVVQWSVGQAWAQVEPRRLIERALATTGTATTLLLPPQRPTHSSFPSPQAHQAPVLRLAIHGDVSCHHLYSISQEGKVCTWPAWQPLHPTASCLSYLGIRPMGNIGVAARFVERPGTDAMTQVFIGTTSGALLVGANRDAKSIELQYYGPPRPLPTSSTVIRTLDVTASPFTAATAAAAAVAAANSSADVASPNATSVSMDSSIGLGARNPTTTPAGAGVQSAPSAIRRPSTRSVSPSTFSPLPGQPPHSSSQPPLPHRGRIVSLSLQTAAHGFRGQDCVVSAATDGTCAAWFPRAAVPLEGFSSAVTSVCWSPTKPGVLAAGDASGLVTLWAVNTSIITPVGTVSLREASRRTRGSATSDAVLWVVSGASDAAGMGGGGGGGGFFGGGPEEEEEMLEDGGADASLGQADAVGAAISSVFFSRDGRWLFASTACGYVYSMRVSASLA